MKSFDYYSKPPFAYPIKADFTTLYAYDKGKCVFETTPGGPYTKPHIQQKFPNAVIQEILNTEAFKNARNQYKDRMNELHTEFTNDLFEEFGVVDNEKRFKCFNLAWDLGHAHGYEEVYNKFSELVELIKD